MNPKLVVVPFALLQWLAVWGMRFLPHPIKNPALRAAAQIVFPSAAFGVWVLQSMLYQHLTGIAELRNDDYFFLLTAVECIVSLGIIFRVAYEYRSRARDAKSR